MRKLLKAAALVALLALPGSAAFGQGIPYHDIALSAQGRPLAGVNISICTSLQTTSAAVTAAIATLTFASNPQTLGFVVGASLQVSGFQGNDSFFNGTYTIAVTSSNTISYVLNHANATASSTGTVLQTGNATTPCAPLASIFSDVGLTQATTQPFQTDGLGNWSFFAAPGPYNAVLAGAANTLKVVPIQLASGSPFSTQIVSTVPAGTAPLSIASTTVVPNLNAQLHNGLTAPASAIVGISDTQTLTNKTLTSASNGNSVTLICSSGPAAAITGNGSPQTFFSCTIPANAVANLKALRVTLVWSHSTGTAAITYGLTLNGVACWPSSNSSAAVGSHGR